MAYFNYLRRLKYKNFSNARFLISASIITSLSGFLTNLIWSRWLPVDVYGSYQVLISAVGVIGTFCQLGAGQAALMSAAQNFDGNFIKIVKKKLSSNFVGSLMFIGLALYFFYSDGSLSFYFYGFLVAAALFPLYNLNDIWLAWLNGKGLFYDLSLNRVVNYTFSLIAVVVIAIFKISEFWQIVFIFFAIVIIQNVWMLEKVSLLRVNRNEDKSILLLGSHTTIAMMLSGLGAMDVLILNHFYSANEVAIYAMSFVLPEILRNGLSIVTQLYAPKLNNGTSPIDFWRDNRINFFVICLLFFGFGILGYLFLPLVVPLLFSNKYIEAVSYSQYLWVATAFLGPFGLLGKSVIATKKLLYTYISHLGFPILVFILYACFISNGIYGLIEARVITMLVIHAFYALSFFRLVKCN